MWVAVEIIRMVFCLSKNSGTGSYVIDQIVATMIRMSVQNPSSEM